jgi:F420-non-reducing hydrogenase iron-sulfur subunit
MGIEDDRFRLEWISASEGDRLRSVMIDMVDKVRALGPLNWNASVEEVAVS